MEIRNELRYLLSVGLWERMAADGLLTKEELALESLGLLVVDLIAVDVDQLSVLFRELDAEVDRIDRVFTGEFKVRDRADAVRAHPDGVLHELLAVRIAHDALLRKGDDLDVDDPLELLLE